MSETKPGKRKASESTGRGGNGCVAAQKKKSELFRKAEHEAGEMRQDKSMCLVLGRICCSSWGGWTTGGLTMEGKAQNIEKDRR